MTYRQHFALERYPFQAPACTDELFPARACSEAEARLLHLLELRGIGLLTGEAGCGKTSIWRKVAASLQPSRYKLLHVALTTGSAFDTYRMIGWELGLDVGHARALACRSLRGELTRIAAETGRLPVLVVDEAHNLRNDVLEELRLLTGPRPGGAPCLCLLLAGLSSLERRLSMNVNLSLHQRIVVRHRHGGLERDEIEPCLQHRLRLAGCELPLFRPAAIEALFPASRGLPRMVSRIAHYALAAAAGDRDREVSAAHVERALDETRPRPLGAVRAA